MAREDDPLYITSLCLFTCIAVVATNAENENTLSFHYELDLRVSFRNASQQDDATCFNLTRHFSSANNTFLPKKNFHNGNKTKFSGEKKTYFFFVINQAVLIERLLIKFPKVRNEASNFL